MQLHEMSLSSSSIWAEPLDAPCLILYVSFCSTVYIVADIVTGILPYWVRGWTSFEYLVCMLIKVSNESEFSDWDQVLQSSFAHTLSTLHVTMK